VIKAPRGIIGSIAEAEMNRQQLSIIRHYLGKTQRELAQLLGTSPKAMWSFEKGWRRIPVHVQRQVLFLLTMKMRENACSALCWEVKQCPMEKRKDCPAWEFRCGDLCWFINGTICQGGMQKDWHKKMKICEECEVFRASLSAI
jgi:DNA-binding XRE family transcriptional regulator